MLTIAHDEVRSAVSMAEAITAVRQAFLDVASGLFEMPMRTSLDGGSLLVMSAHHRPTDSAVTKTLSVNFERRPSIVGSLVHSSSTHEQQLVMEASAVTALRTGAATGVATDLLAPRDAKSVVMIGAGVQAADQIRAVCSVRDVHSVGVLDPDAARAQALCDSIRAEFGAVDFYRPTDAGDALALADIVCCATPSTTPLFESHALAEHVHVNAIGSFRPGMRELPGELLADSLVVVDERAAALSEAGEIIHAVESESLESSALIELGPLLTSGLPTRPSRTVFKSVGVAAQDWAIAHLVAERLSGVTVPA